MILKLINMIKFNESFKLKPVGSYKWVFLSKDIDLFENMKIVVILRYKKIANKFKRWVKKKITIKYI